MLQGKLFAELTMKFNESTIYESLILVSAIINAIFFTLMWMIDELQVHPMQLFAMILALDATTLFT